MQRLLPLVAAFGDRELARRLARCSRSAWSQPSDGATAGLVHALDLTIHYAAGDEPSREEIAVARTRPMELVTKGVTIGGILDALAALVEHDAPELRAVLQHLLRVHRDEAKAGAWTTSYLGLIAWWPIAFCKLAREANLDVDLESPYVPLAALA